MVSGVTKVTFSLMDFLLDQNPPIRELVEMGMVPVFVKFLKNDKNAKLQVTRTAEEKVNVDRII